MNGYYDNRMGTNTFGERLRLLRESRGLGVRELGRRSGVNHATISLAERNQRWVDQLPSIEVMEQLAQALGITVEELRGTKHPISQIVEQGAELSATGAGHATGSAELNQLADIGRAVLRIVEERQMLTEKRLVKVERAGRYFAIINRVPADDARERDSQIEDRIKLDPFFWEDATDPRVYIVGGDCMVMSGILNDDHVVIDAAEVQPRNGQVVLAQLNNALTLKRFYRTAEGIELRPNAPGYDTIVVKPGDELVIVGCLHTVVPTGAR